MEAWIQHTLGAQQLSVSMLPAAFVLGVLGAITSCCTLPVIGAVVGYAGGIGAQRSRRELLTIAVFFALGTIAALAALGAVAGFVGDVAGAALGKYWRFASGLLMVAFGLIAIGLLQLRWPSVKIGPQAARRGFAGALLYGVALGGATTACSFGCNPLLPLAIGAAVLKGATLHGALLLTVFAVGYSLPLAAGLIGVGFGLAGLSRIAARIMPAARIAGGALMVAIGFYLLAAG